MAASSPSRCLFLAATALLLLFFGRCSLAVGHGAQVRQEGQRGRLATRLYFSFAFALFFLTVGGFETQDLDFRFRGLVLVALSKCNQGGSRATALKKQNKTKPETFKI